MLLAQAQRSRDARHLDPGIRTDVFGRKLKLNDQDFQSGLEFIQNLVGDAIGAPKIPTVQWEDVGGLEEAKKEILDTVQVPLLHPELLESGMKRSGILM